MAKPKIKKKKEEYVKVCPKCKSPDISLDKSTLQETGAFPTMYICNKCNHSGYAFPEVKLSELDDFEKEVDEEKIRNEEKDQSELIDTTPGKFEVRVVWKYASILVILISLGSLIFNPLGAYSLIYILFLFIGLLMLYITYFKKRKLKD